ncbi:MAG: rod shape-determining protein MreD [Sphingomonas sp.]|nr:rod shape-determining protein MreD [Sphingomonas sp.]
MVRSALASRPGSIDRGPHPAFLSIPAASVLVASLTAMLPIVSMNGWWPDAGLLFLLAWRLLRADAWPAWLAAPMGLVHDLLTGSPVGLSMVLWPSFMLALDIVDRRTMWRDYWIEWLVAALFLSLAEAAQWQVAVWDGAEVRFATVAPAIIIAIFSYPIVAFLVSRIDRWRAGR